MSNHQRVMFDRHLALVAAAGAALAASGPAAMAVTYTYTPTGTSDSWNGGTGWSPSGPVSAADTRLTFGDNTTVLPAGHSSSTNNDIAGNFQLNAIDLQGSGPSTGSAAITIAGNPLQLVADGAANPVANLNALLPALQYTLVGPVVLSNNTTFTGNGTAGFTLSGGISGAGSLTKTGTSTLVISTTNSYTGGTVVSGGTLRATGVSALPSYTTPGQVLVNSGATLAVSAGGAGQWTAGDIDTLRTSGAFAAGSSLGLHVEIPTFTYASNVSGNIGLTKSGSGTLVLDGANTYTGTTRITAGTLQANTAANLAGYNVAGRVNVAAGTLRVAAGGSGWTSSELDGLVTSATFATGAALNVDVATGNSAAIAANISGPVALNKSGAGTLTLTGTNTQTGQTTFSNGTLVINNGSQLGSGLLFWGSTTLPGATLQLTSATPVTIANDVTFDSSNTNNTPATLAAATDVTFTGTIRNSDGNGRFDVNNSGLTVLSGPVHLSDSTGTRNLRFAGSGDIRIDGVVSNGTAGSPSTSLTYQGTGTMTLTNSNTHNNRTQVIHGTLVFTSVNAFGTSAIWLGATGSVNAGGTLIPATGGPATLNNSMVVDSSDNNDLSGIIGGTTPLTINGSLSNDDGQGRLEVNNTALTTFAGPVNLSTSGSNRTLRIRGTGDVLISGNVDEGTQGAAVCNLTYEGSGTLTLTGNNSHAGRTTVASGTVVINNDAQLGDSTAWLGTGTTSGTLHVNDSGATIARPIVVDSNHTAGTAGIISATAPLTISGSISNSDANGVLHVNNTALTTVTGPVHLSDDDSVRTLRIGGSGNVTISGAIGNGTLGAPTGNLTYQGTGTLALTGANTYAGTTTVTSGTVNVTDVAIPAGNAVSVSGGAYVMSGAAAAFKLAGLQIDSAGAATVTAGNNTLSTTSLTIGSTSRLNLNDNDLLVDYGALDPSPESTIRQYVRDGRASGSTTGIFSTPGSPADDVVLAVADNAEWGKTVFNGIDIDASTIVGKYTYFGDSNLDGQVTGDDYLAVDSNLGTGNSWIEGDFNLDNSVTGDDYLAIDTNLGKGTSNPLAYAELKTEMVAKHVAMFGDEYLVKLAEIEANGFTTVPEPTGLGLPGALALLARRRRRL